MSAETKWQLIETGKAILIGVVVLVAAALVFGISFGECPRC